MNDLKNSDADKVSIPTQTENKSSKDLINKIDRFLTYKYTATKLSTLTKLALIKIANKDKV